MLATQTLIQRPAKNMRVAVEGTLPLGVTAKDVIHVASVHQFNVAEKTYKTVPGSGGVSAEANTLEATYAWNWAQNIWADSLL